MVRRLGEVDAEFWMILGVRAAAVLAVAVAAIVVLVLGRRLLLSVQRAQNLPQAMMLPLRRAAQWTVIVLALVLALQFAGFSVTAIWTGLSAILALIAIGFIAVWSVLSNVACSLMLMIFKPFRIGDHVEIYEKPEGPNIGGRVTNVTLMYVVLKEDSGASAATVQIPNNLFFQKTIRRRESANSVAIEDHVQQHGLTGREQGASPTSAGA